ncbi:MAG: hypothetical protein E7B40_06025 [Actinomyces sp.]|nr:hypothetical protein [Actinomyces sp.]
MSTVVEAARGERQGFISSKLNWLRAGVLGANDGIVSIAGLLIGIAAVDPTNVMWTEDMKTNMGQQMALAMRGDITAKEALDAAVKYGNDQLS